MIKAVVFDMGGTLLHVRHEPITWRELETPGIRNVYRYIVEQGHLIAAHEDVFVEAMFNRLAAGWVQATSGQANLRALDWIEHGLADQALNLQPALLAEAVQHYARPLSESVSAAPGAAATLATLQSMGMQLGLVSNTIWPGELHRKDLDRLGLLDFFTCTLFSGDLGVWKPHAEIFMQALNTLGVAPHEAVFVGDSPSEDIIGAKHVGMRAIWVANDEFLLGDAQPDAIIQGLPEIPALLYNW